MNLTNQLRKALKEIGDITVSSNIRAIVKKALSETEPIKVTRRYRFTQTRNGKTLIAVGDHSDDCAKHQNLKSDCTCGVKDRVEAQYFPDTTLGIFASHCGECEQCRSVFEAFFAEANQPHPLCDCGRSILEKGKAS